MVQWTASSFTLLELTQVQPLRSVPWDIQPLYPRRMQFNPSSTELISKVGPPFPSFLGYDDWTAFSAAVRFPAFQGNLLRIGENEYCLLDIAGRTSSRTLP